MSFPLDPQEFAYQRTLRRLSSKLYDVQQFASCGEETSASRRQTPSTPQSKSGNAGRKQLVNIITAWRRVSLS
jgi:hypothetical protein